MKKSLTKNEKGGKMEKKGKIIVTGGFVLILFILGYFIVKGSRQSPVSNLIQGEALIILAIITAYYAKQTKELVAVTKESVKVGEQSAREAKESIEEHKRTREIDFLERRLIYFHEPIVSKLYSLRINLESYITKKGIVDSDKKELISQAIQTIWDTNEKYGYMTSESFGGFLRDITVKCLDLLAEPDKEIPNLLENLKTIHLGLIGELIQIRKFIRDEFPAIWVEIKKGDTKK